MANRHITNPIDKTKLSRYTPHRCNTTVSLETYPLYSKEKSAGYFQRGQPAGSLTDQFFLGGNF